ncbi:hypothetical protein B0H63DRAFT_489482 [Podospora didyma]|uniref:Uncharacterized protein n=1 Tax=Podospora didyma TaxID=330526 RepID=A0AAE0N2A0_9PEZI|nr:hypothetical protein B0H63DRAFT_489482 [Podospora didyma]
MALGIWGTLKTLGIALWVLKLVGFGPMGPIAGKLAPLLQSRYNGYIPAKSVFSMLQKMAMKP